MQVSATLIAAQQAAREAQARFQQVHAPTLQASFASALTEMGKTAETGATDGFSALPLKQTAPQAASPSAPAPQGTGSPVRLGQHLDITV